MIYQLKINLDYMTPPVWRRIELSSETKLEELHQIIQILMSWEDEHLHGFTVNRMCYFPPNEWGDDEEDESFSKIYIDVLLKDVLKKEKDKMQYTYDFGSKWRHTILLEKIKEQEDGVFYPRCIKGKGHCPVEDCLEDVYNAFDIDGINELLKKS